MSRQHGFALLQIQCILGKGRLFRAWLPRGGVAALENADVHLAVDGRQKGEQGGKAQFVRLLLGISAEVQILHDLRQELRSEGIGFRYGLDVLHDQ